MTSVRIRHFIAMTAAEGPGLRACLWVQGCSIRCPGCFNRHMWDRDGGSEVSVDDLVWTITREPDIEGATLLGGEPFDQAPALAELAARLRRRDLSVMTFTGYVLEDMLRHPRAGWLELLSETDLLVDGPYDADHPDSSRPWVGSYNQRFIFLTPRYREIAGQIESTPDRLELRIGTDGMVFLNGQGPQADMWALIRDLELRNTPYAARTRLV